MNTTEALKSVCHFYECILPKASCSPYWNEKIIANAFLWTELCEKIYVEFSDGPINREFDEQMHLITESCKGAGMSYCIEDLKNCKSRLCQAFFQNPNFERTYFENMFSKVGSAELNSSEIWNDAMTLDSLCIELVDSLMPMSIVNSDRSLYYEVRAELFLNFLGDLMEQLDTEEQLETHLSLAFETLCGSRDKLGIILHILLYEPAGDLKDISELQDFTINWIILKLLKDKSCPLAHFVWKQPPDELRGIASRYAAFYSYYVDFLENCATSLTLEFENGIRQWKTGILTDEVVLSYSEIIIHFESLLSDDSILCEAGKERLATLMNTQSNTAIWRDIVSCINT